LIRDVVGRPSVGELQFDENKCLNCVTGSCLSQCRYVEFDSLTAASEMVRIARGEDSSVLHNCVTCYACEEYCPEGNHPFYLIVERQEALNVPPVPRPLIRRGVNLGVPFRGEPEAEEVHGPVLNMGAFSELLDLIQGRLFENVTVISTDQRKMFHYFCQLMYLHYGRSSVIKERLPGIIDTILKHKPTEVVCFHDECYGAYTSYCPAVEIDVPFTAVHFFEFLYNRLTELKEVLRPLGMRVAYQRPCSARLSPDKHHFVRDIFDLVGAEGVAREYVGENALCCGGAIQGQKREGSRKRAVEIQRKNVEDMKKAGAQICIFNCPACFQTLSALVAQEGMKPMYMSDLCRLAIGEKPSARR
jgi:Fe-S oxidoreductase